MFIPPNSFAPLASLRKHRFGFGFAFALFLDHFGRRLIDKRLVAELAFDLLDLGRPFFTFLLEPRAFLVEIDDIGQRQRHVTSTTIVCAAPLGISVT